MKLEGKKVVLATEMARIEKCALKAKADGAQYMDAAASCIARCVQDFIAKHHLEDKVTLLVGKGNNGGDAFLAGVYLLKEKLQVQAVAAYCQSEVSELCQKQWTTFVKAGGRIITKIKDEGVFVDGFLGTGATGGVNEPLLSIIDQVNCFDAPKIAIDIPSGLNGNTGEVITSAIQADLTIFLGLPKTGFFLLDGMDHIGDIVGCDFGMDQKYLDDAKPSGFLLSASNMSKLLPKIKRTRHKYQAGYVVALAGSPGMPGAAMMSARAAYRTGCGMVRLFHPPGMDGEFKEGPEELVRSTWTVEDTKFFQSEMQRASACLLGPGMGRAEDSGVIFKQALQSLKTPALIDADGLYWLSHMEKSFDVPVVLTPHKKEMERLLKGPVSPEAVQSYAEQMRVTIVLKGAPTWIFHPHRAPLIMDRGTPGLATAGTGDVLAGMIVSLLAQKLGALEAACLGSWLHALCGEKVALDKTPYSLMATDLCEQIPSVLSEIIYTHPI